MWTTKKRKKKTTHNYQGYTTLIVSYFIQCVFIQYCYFFILMLTLSHIWSVGAHFSWLPHHFDTSPSLLEHFFLSLRTGYLFQRHFVLSRPQTWKQLFLQGVLIPRGPHTLCCVAQWQESGTYLARRVCRRLGSQVDLRTVGSSPQHADALFTLLWLQHPVRDHVPQLFGSGIITVACPHKDALLAPTPTPSSVSPLRAIVAFFLLLAPRHDFWPQLFRKAKEEKGKRRKEKRSKVGRRVRKQLKRKKKEKWKIWGKK